MIFNSFFTQIVMAVLAVGILYFYVHPTFTNIGVIQDSIMQYQAEKEKVDGVNERLVDLNSRMESIPPESNQALMTYLPEEVDQMSVSRDILTMTEEANVYLESIRYDKTTPRPTDKDNNFIRHNFSMSVSGTYEDIKLFLSKLEQNNCPLEVSKLSISVGEDSLMKADMNVVTYSYTNTI